MILGKKVFKGWTTDGVWSGQDTMGRGLEKDLMIRMYLSILLFRAEVFGECDDC